MSAPVYVADLWLTHLIPQLVTLQVSETSSSGPWTDLPLTAATPFRSALTAWLAAANAAPGLSGTYGGGYTFGVSVPQPYVSFSCDVPAWVQLTPTQQVLMGFEAAVLDIYPGPVTSSAIVLGAHRPKGIAIAAPVPRTRAELMEYRGGRVDSYVSRRETIHRVEVLVQEDDIDALEGGQIYRAGKHRLQAGGYAAYGVDNMDGYLDCYPLPGSLEIDRVEGTEAEAILTFLVSVGR